MLCETGVYLTSRLRDITNTTSVILHLNVSEHLLFLYIVLYVLYM